MGWVETAINELDLAPTRLNLGAAVQKAPDNVEARYWLAKLYETLKMQDKALAAWAKAGELAANKPEHTKIAPEIAEALERLKR